jgi:hypothetical protein
VLTFSSTVKWAAGHDETVEVNQRALIDKVLARYSGKFTGKPRLPRVPWVALLDMASVNTVFRELLQNSDDAEARSVEIRFETEAYLSREKGDDLQSDKSKREDLPDLKSAVACGLMVFT